VSVSTVLRLLFLLAFTIFAARAQAAGLTVFAAASLKNALDEVVAAYRVRTGTKVTVSYAASSALARQIEQGAPADIFISADQDWMDYLGKRRLIEPASRMNLLRNRIVLIAPAASDTKLAIAPGFPLAAALGEERLAMADPNAVPAGRYGRSALEKLGVWNAVRTKVAAAANVRAALLLVARGEAPFGIVYRTDALVEPRVRIVDVFPESTHPPIIYPAAIVAQSTDAAAEGFLRSLRAPQARATFERYGFR
jgi:molybdate transport system substrate-binding protein